MNIHAFTHKSFIEVCILLRQTTQSVHTRTLFGEQLKHKHFAVLSSLVLMLGGAISPGFSTAEPTGGVVKSGSGSINSAGLTDTKVITVKQTSLAPLVIHWDSFNVGLNETVTLNWNNPFRSGDTFTFSGLSSGALLNYQRMAYERPIGSPGMQLGVSYAQMQYRLGEGAESLQAHGSLGQQTVWLDYPWLKNTRQQFKTRIQYEYMDPADHQDASNLKTDRNLRIFTVSTNHENADTFMRGGLNQWSMELAHGQTGFSNTVAAANDEVTARTAGRFTKVNLRGYRNQAINPLFSLSLSMDGQWAQKNLDATQKFSLGGLRSVRAYEAGALSADTCIFSSVELRMLLPQPDDNWNIQGQWYASVFWDKAVARVNQNPWTDKSNDAYLHGTGLALYWQGPNEWRATVSLGKSLGVTSSLLNSADALHKTAWLELAKGWR